VSDPTNGDSESLATPTAPMTIGGVPVVGPDEDDDLLDDPGLAFAAPDPGPDEGAIDDLLGDLLPDDVEERLSRLETTLAPGRPEGDVFAQRVHKLEQAAQALAAAELARDGRRVHRKVSAATLGAFVAALIPVLLQLAGAFDLKPEVTSALSAAAALVGAFAAGWSTPERQPSLPAQTIQQLVP